MLTRFFPSASKAEAMASKMTADLKPELGIMGKIIISFL